MKRILVAIALLFASAPAFAQQQPFGYPITVGTAQVQVLPADPQRKRVVFFNPNLTALVAVCPAISRVNSVAITCTVNGAGSITLLPYATFPVDGVGQNGTIPSPWNAIASAPGAALTILEFE